MQDFHSTRQRIIFNSCFKREVSQGGFAVKNTEQALGVLILPKSTIV